MRIIIPIHIGDFLGGTIGMDAQEVGAYFLLIIAHYQAGEQGLRNDDVYLARVARVTNKVWKKLRPRLEEKFDVTDDFWRHKRVIKGRAG